MKTIKHICLLTIALSIFTGCEISSIDEVKEQSNVTIIANDANTSSAVTKTTLNNSTFAVAWNDSDNLTVFNAETGTTVYSDNCRFLISDPSTGSFVKDPSETGKTLPFADGTNYDWYVCSSWKEFASSPAGSAGYVVNRTPKQIGYSSSTHLTESDIMVGKAVNTRTPVITLKHMCSLLKFTLTNNSGSATTITNITLDATEGGTYITGSYKLDFTGDTPALDPTQMGSAKAYTSSLDITSNGTDIITETIPNGESRDFYMIVAPFSIASGKKITITVTGSNGICTIEKTMTSAISFQAGKYNTANINYTNPERPLFKENFGTAGVSTANVATYNKSGLYTFYPEDKAGYGYASYNNASFQIASFAGQTLSSGAYVKFPKGSASITIKGIELHDNTTLTFSYTKDVLNSSTRTTVAKWRLTGETTWANEIGTSTANGLISHDFTVTNPEGKTIEIMVQCPDSYTTSDPYPALDNFKLVIR